MEHEIFYTRGNNNLRCVICFDDISDLSKKLLNRICLCEDSLICDDCLNQLKKNNIIKCPVCRRNLHFSKSYFILINIFIFLK